MKIWLKVMCPLLLIAVILYGGTQWSGRKLRAAVEKVRRELRQQGFKTELTDFNFTTPAEVSARADAIVSAGHSLLRRMRELELMEPVGTNVALAVSPVQIIEIDPTPYDASQSTNLWPLVAMELSEHPGELDRACVALLAGPVRFQPTFNASGMLLPSLGRLRNLADTLAARAVVDMHAQNTNSMVTNILGLSRMVTAWSPEPVDISHMVRFACVSIAQRALWESMQTDLWKDDQLATLQREWESARFFDGLPETAELSCANMVWTCQAARAQNYWANFGGWRAFLRDLRDDPKNGFQMLWGLIQGVYTHASYRNHGSYEDEKALMLYYRDRREELKHAVTGSFWVEIRSLPGATNSVAFQGAKSSRIGLLINLKQTNLGFMSEGRTLLARAAEAETRRRLIVTAIALERFAIQHQTYPQSLAEIVPAFLPAVPLDFMDGMELRYQRLADGRYLLYSVGLDGVDNGGQMVTPEQFSAHYLSRGGNPMLAHFNTDIVWPLRATQADVDLFEQQQKEYERALPSPPKPYLPEALERQFTKRYGGASRPLKGDTSAPPLRPDAAKPESSEQP